MKDEGGCEYQMLEGSREDGNKQAEDCRHGKYIKNIGQMLEEIREDICNNYCPYKRRREESECEN